MQGVHARHDCRTVLDMRNCPAKRLLVLGNQTYIGNDQLTAKRMQVSERRSNVPSTSPRWWRTLDRAPSV